MKRKKFVRNVTRKGQVTIPKAIRDLFGIEPKGKVFFFLEGDRIYISKALTLEDAYGAVEPLNRPEDFSALRDKAIENRIEKTMREMRSNNEVP